MHAIIQAGGHTHCIYTLMHTHGTHTRQLWASSSYNQFIKDDSDGEDSSDTFPASGANLLACPLQPQDIGITTGS